MDVKKRKAGSLLKRVDMTTILILFFLGVVMAYYTSLQSEMKQKVIISQELVATKSADQINEYLSRGIDIINITTCTLDGMIREGSSPAKIQDYLESQTDVAEHITDGKTTGMYAVVEDVFFSGAGWVPDGDYVPKERPWYGDAMANIGHVAVVDPYIDAKTNTMMITLAKSLADVKSVAAMDLSLEPLQKMTEELAANGDSEIEIVMDRKYRVLAHSDRGEVGKRYIAEEDTFGRALVDKLRSSNEKYFSLRFGDAEYIVYTMPVADSWICLSVFDATATFAQLRRTFLMTLFVSLLVISILLFIMNRFEEETRLAQEYNRKAEAAAAATEAKSSFLSNMSHEIRTPINAILGMNEMILRECEERNILGYSENIKTAGNTLLSLINSILDFSKIEAGKIDIIPVEYDLSSLLNDLVIMVKARAEKKNLSINLDFDTETPRLLYGDEVRIKQIIANILTNAVKYTERGGVTFSLGFERIEGAEDKVVITVAITDTGIGIKAEDMGKLFSKFERIEEERNRNIEGTGLGMTITKMLLDNMDSKLEVASVYGEGSTFSFRLEQKVVKWEPLGDYKASYAESLKNQKKYHEKFTAPEAHVLVVDDNPMNLMVFKSLLKQTRMQIDMANDGNECLLLTKDKKYDIIFLDHMMPGKDGIETLHELKQQRRNINRQTPTVCLTANAISGAREKYIEAGFNDYLSKPIDSGKLEDMLIKYLPKEKIEKAMVEEPRAETENMTELPEMLNPLQGQDWIDVHTGIKNSGDIEAYLPLLQIFYESMEERAEEIEGFYEAGNIKDYTTKVHALKSSARLIGAMEFGEEAQRLENAGKANDLDYIQSHNETFMENYRSFKEPLAMVFVSQEEEKPEADMDFLESVYEEICSAAEEHDAETLEAIFTEMEEYAMPEGEQQRWEQLKMAVSEQKYDDIANILK
ncbi:hybrid sensor histidine kinase/response regulator [Anaerovibrio sp. RM50]|uniref:hybrid sensor histidine kinase/response regulator n=1 Tax=Anaerovibrio sp. RM50 TaxID=1200557 RepID=UPI000687F54B|nr:hybrid sensor histidine kinase/response regulator [Anaerovibrio sp. RM50]